MWERIKEIIVEFLRLIGLLKRVPVTPPVTPPVIPSPQPGPSLVDYSFYGPYITPSGGIGYGEHGLIALWRQVHGCEEGELKYGMVAPIGKGVKFSLHLFNPRTREEYTIWDDSGKVIGDRAVCDDRFHFFGGWKSLEPPLPIGVVISKQKCVTPPPPEPNEPLHDVEIVHLTLTLFLPDRSTRSNRYDVMMQTSNPCN